MWVLQLNDMRAPKIEMKTSVARAETMEELEAFIERERVNYYKDKHWGKTFKKDGPLEWFNLPAISGQHIINVGDAEIWSERAKADYEAQVMSIPVIK